MPRLVGVLERRGARRPDGTFAEALFAVPPSGAGPPAAALTVAEDGPEVDLGSRTTSPSHPGRREAIDQHRVAQSTAAKAMMLIVR